MQTQKKYFLLLLIIVTSCKEFNFDNYLFTPRNTTLFKDSIGLSLDNTLEISVPKSKFSRYHSLAIYEDTLLFCVNQKKRNVIDIYNLKQQTFIKNITVDDALLHDRISGMAIKSPDSIYFCQSMPQMIFLINNNGKVLNKWNEVELMVNMTSQPKLSKYQINFNTYLGIHKPFIDNNLFYISTDPKGMYKIYPSIDRIGIYDLSSRKWQDFICGEENISYPSKYCYSHDLEQPYVLCNDEYVFVSYPMEHYIYKYSKDSGVFLEKIACFSQYVDSFPRPPKCKMIDSGCQEAINFRNQTPFYGPVFYHEKSKLFTRVLHFPQKLIDTLGNMNSGTDRKASIIILNEKLSIVGEELFLHGSLGVFSYLPLTDGFIIGSQRTKENESFLSYNSIYKFKN